MTNQPDWHLVYATDYSALYEDTTGVYDSELVIAQDLNDGTFEVFRFSIERCALAKCPDERDDPTARSYLVHANMVDRDLPHPFPRYEEWFAKELASVAASVGSSHSDLVEALCSEDVGTRAQAYEAIGGYHGYQNLDGYPETWNESNMSAWPDKGPDVDPDA